MAGIKETFSKGLTTLNVKTNNFMEGTTIKTHINTLESECSELCRQIGENVFGQWMKGDVSIGAAEPLLQSMKEKQAEIAGERAKLEELQRMEENILGKKNPAPAPAGGEQIFCSQCGGVNSSIYKFCCKCGAPLVK